MDVYLETERLVLRRLTPDDLDDLVALDSDPEVMRWVTGAPTPRAVIELDFLPAWLAYYERGDRYGFWAAIVRATGEFLGWFHFRPPLGSDDPDVAELGYRLKRSAWGQGYATEGSRALIRKGFEELGVRRVVALTAEEHAASRRVMEKAGLMLARTFPCDLPGWEGTNDVEYALDRADWERRRAMESGLAADSGEGAQ